jgi:Iodothyronine deiodinase
MHQTPEEFGRVMAHMPMPAYFLFPFEAMWTQARHGHLSPGDQAPDLTVTRLETKAPVQLASLWTSKPVVLVFGSYTCPPFRREVPP